MFYETAYISESSQKIKNTGGCTPGSANHNLTVTNANAQCKIK
jgi:hypothetical protein